MHTTAYSYKVIKLENYIYKQYKVLKKRTKTLIHQTRGITD